MGGYLGDCVRGDVGGILLFSSGHVSGDWTTGGLVSFIVCLDSKYGLLFSLYRVAYL